MCSEFCAEQTSRAAAFINGSIARSATRRYLSYTEVDFEVYRPAAATRCNDGVKFGMEEGTVPSLPNFTPIGETISV